jgi:mediator of RNA polymerase II transcription subunit 18
MSSHSYEVILFGDFFAKDLKPILNRITLHSDSSRPFQSREVVFEPVGAQTNNTEPVYLRAKKEISDPNASWYVVSNLMRVV